MRSHAAAFCTLALALALTSSASDARAQSIPDWNAHAGEDTVSLVTHDPDGVVRDTTVWLAVVDGQGYLRTGNTRWRGNLDRDPDAVLRVAGKEYPLRAQQVTDPERIDRITAVFREKYGFSDRFIGWFTSDDSRYFIAMVARPPAP